MNNSITLSKPIHAHGETVSDLTLNAPTLGALDGIELSVGPDGTVKFNLGDISKLVANMTGIPPSSAAQISLADVGKLVEPIQSFLSDFLPIGKT